MSGLRSVDTSYRLEGEEFVFLMPETDGEMARAAAEGLRRLVMETPIKFDGVDIAVTVSFGVAELSPQDNDLSEMLKRADEALYEAKGAGRNCTVWIDREGEHILKDAEQIKLVA